MLSNESEVLISSMLPIIKNIETFILLPYINHSNFIIELKLFLKEDFTNRINKWIYSNKDLY